MNLNEAFGKILASKRKEMCLTQAQLAEICGLDDKYISDIERAFKNPTLKTMESLAKGLKISLSEIIELAEGLATK